MNTSNSAIGSINHLSKPYCASPAPSALPAAAEAFWLGRWVMAGSSELRSPVSVTPRWVAPKPAQVGVWER